MRRRQAEVSKKAPMQRQCCRAVWAQQQAFASRADVQRKLRTYVASQCMVSLFRTIPFQQGLACSFDVEATAADFDTFVAEAAKDGCRVHVLQETDRARQDSAPCLGSKVWGF